VQFIQNWLHQKAVLPLSFDEHDGCSSTFASFLRSRQETESEIVAATKKFIVALPVRNGGEFLKNCVRSVLEQTYNLLRLVVLDNASTDGSVAWLRSLSDSRLEISESSKALSIEENWGRICHLESSDEYLTIIGHDDLFDAQFLTSMSALIDEFPDANLYHSKFRLIDSQGRTIRRALSAPIVEKDHEFLAARLAFKRDSFGTGYVVKMKDFVKVGGIPQYKRLMFADDALWLTLMAGSYKATLQEECFSYRAHVGSASYAPDWRSVFEALYCYLGLLKLRATEDARIRAALANDLENYLEFWLRWAYFSEPRFQRDKEEFERAILKLAETAGPLLELSAHKQFTTLGRGAIFSRLSTVRWTAWRARKWISLWYASHM
jgi:glycosyltransferase involved in cell wall biosynthesis